MRKSNVRIFERQSVSDTNTDKLGICCQQCIFLTIQSTVLHALLSMLKSLGHFSFVLLYIYFYFLPPPPPPYVLDLNDFCLCFCHCLVHERLIKQLCVTIEAKQKIFILFMQSWDMYFLNPVLNPDYNFEQTLLRNTSPVLCLNKEIPGKAMNSVSFSFICKLPDLLP